MLLSLPCQNEHHRCYLPGEVRLVMIHYRLQKDERRALQGRLPNFGNRRLFGHIRRSMHILNVRRQLCVLTNQNRRRRQAKGDINIAAQTVQIFMKAGTPEERTEHVPTRN